MLTLKYAGLSSLVTSNILLMFTFWHIKFIGYTICKMEPSYFFSTPTSIVLIGCFVDSPTFAHFSNVGLHLCSLPGVFSLFLYSTAISCSLVNFSPGNWSVCCTSPSAFPWAPGTQFISSKLPLLPATVGSIWHHFPSCSGQRGELFVLSPFHYSPI